MDVGCWRSHASCREISLHERFCILLLRCLSLESRFSYSSSHVANRKSQVRASLADIASIQVGYTFRSGVTADPEGDSLVVQMKDLSEVTAIEVATLDRILFDQIKEAHALQEGDIVFRSRGSKMAGLSMPACKLPVVLAAPLFRVRVTDDRVLPGYLSWYLSQAQAQGYLDGVAEGTLQRMVSKASLLALPVDFPDLKTQQLLLDIANLAAQEVSLTQTILNHKSRLITSCLARAIQET
jgi:hypothetical protein